MNAALTCAGVAKRLGGRTVLHGLDLEVERGEVVSLIGASGSGKTTLLRIIAGLHDPDFGEVAVEGRTVWSNKGTVPAEKRRIGMVFQDYALWPHMSVARNLDFGLKAQRLPGTEVTARVSHALGVTRLDAYSDRRPNELSGGQQQRVAIARCLAARPALMLFDEPLSNLDAALREDMRMEMMELVRREGITVVYVTHDQAEAMAVSDRIAVMREGRIAQYDTPEQIYAAPADSFVASFIGGFSLLRGDADGGRFRVCGPEGDDATIVSTSSAHRGAGFLVVRPDDARPAAAHPENALTGMVVSRAFQGRCWRLVVSVGSQTVRLDWPDSLQIRSELSFSLPPSKCVVLDA